jgi:RNA polymerase sigma-70 factor (ECF subfamily)
VQKLSTSKRGEDTRADATIGDEQGEPTLSRLVYGAEMSSARPVGAGYPDGMDECIESSDAALAIAIGRWHEPALAEAYRRHGAAVLSIARRVLGSAPMAEEVTQEVFLDLWRRPERFDPARGNLRTYLMTKAHGKAVDALRSDSARRAREERSARETATAGYDIEHHAWDLSLADQVRSAISGLPETERRALELAYFGGHTYREVATLLGEPEGTVKSRIRSALRRLREALSQAGAERAWIER